MTTIDKSALACATVALALACTIPVGAQDQGPDGQLAGSDRASGSDRKKAPVEIEQPVEEYLVARMDVVQDAAAGGEGAKPSALLANYVHYGANIVGGQYGDVIFTSTGWSFGTNYPRSVQVQARQGLNNPNTGYPDQFAVQVLSTTATSITVRVRRLDDGTGSSGWGQSLRLDFMVTP